MSSLLLSWIGDDFTGSTDVMEALTLAGVKSALFLDVPSTADIAAMPGLRAAGLASTGRTMSPAKMDFALAPAFAAMKGLGAPLHYKICSTFDSSPEIGSVGHAIEIGRRVFGDVWVPLLVGAPALRRYTCFGNLFATLHGTTHRIDRHPVMRRHPVTPMDEGDLRLHLARQTSLPVALFDLVALEGPLPDVEKRFEALLATQPAVVLFDVVDEDRLQTAGALIARSPFLVGSSGVEYALTAHWKSAGAIDGRPLTSEVGKADRVLVISGSCSEVTERQIAWAEGEGFVALRVPFDGDDTLLLRQSADALSSGRSLVLYSARGPSDPAVRDARSEGQRIGDRLGRLASDLIDRTGVRRVVIAGGDTSGRVAHRLGISSLEMLTPIAPGSPLCRGRRGGRGDLQIALKGGQVGRDDYFGAVLRGKA